MRHFLMVLAILAVAATPVWAATNDQQVANQIAGQLKGGTLKGYEIEVKYAGGTARLDGWVRNAQQMKEALTIAGRTPQVERVINRLNIKLAVPKPLQNLKPAPIQTPPTIKSAPTQGVQNPATETPRPFRTVAQRVAPQAAPGRSASSPRPTLRRTIRKPKTRTTRSALRHVPVRQVSAGRLTAVPQSALMARAPAPLLVNSRASQRPVASYVAGTGGGVAPALYDQPNLPNYAWPTYSAYPNYGALTYPKQYSPTAWPYIGPFYPYPQVPLGWRKVTLEWDDGWWFLDFADDRRHCCNR